MDNYLQFIKFKLVSQLTKVELENWLNEELMNFALGCGYRPEKSDDVFNYAVVQFRNLLINKYRSWNCDGIHRILIMSYTGKFGVLKMKPTFAQLASIMHAGERMKTQMFVDRSERENFEYKKDKSNIISDSQEIGWGLIRWTRKNKVDPELITWDMWKSAYEGNKIEELTVKYRNTR